MIPETLDETIDQTAAEEVNGMSSVWFKPLKRPWWHWPLLVIAAPFVLCFAYQEWELER